MLEKSNPEIGCVSIIFDETSPKENEYRKLFYGYLDLIASWSGPEIKGSDIYPYPHYQADFYFVNNKSNGFEFNVELSLSNAENSYPFPNHLISNEFTEYLTDHFKYPLLLKLENCK